MASPTLGGGIEAVSPTNASGSSTGNQAVYTTGSIILPATQLGLLWVLSARSLGPEVPTFAGSFGGTWTEIGSGIVIGLAADRTLRLFRSLQGTSRSGTIQITHASAHDGCAWELVAVAGTVQSGTNGSGAIIQSGTGFANAATSLSFSISAFASVANLGVAGCGADMNSNMLAGSGWNEIAETGQATPEIRLQVQSALGNNSPSWTYGLRSAAGIAVEVAAAP